MAHSRTHFVGIGGAGMSALARILKCQGHYVTGSDIRSQETVDRLRREGIKVFLGHRAGNLGTAQEVVYSSAISRDNVELVTAGRRGIRVLHRAERLERLMRSRTSVVVTGMHGKTTTTGLAAHLCVQARLAPGFLIGADCPSLGGGAQLGRGKLFIAEADESDGTFLHYRPRYAIVTNIDREHLDYYGGIGGVRKAFGRFFEGVRASGGVLILPWEDPHVRMLIQNGDHRTCLRYGFGPDCDIRAVDVETDKLSSTFLCHTPEGKLGRIRLSLPGRHNVLNALGVIALGWKLGCPNRVLTGALQSFEGVKRRFEVKFASPRLMVVDDYAHHPSEIDAVLECCKRTRRRVVGIFQPHRYSRTRYLARELGRSLARADALILMDIYGADERPLRGAGLNAIYRSVRAHGLKQVHVVRRRVEVLKRTVGMIRSGDLVITLGAGDVGELTDALVRSVPV